MKYLKVPEKIFKSIIKYVPLSCVDAILINNKEFFLVRRKIPPYRNRWCLPGGIIKRGQKIQERLKEVSREELGIEVEEVRKIGVYEKVYKNRHDISHCFVVRIRSGNISLNYQASSGRFFKKIPKNTALFHRQMLRDAGFK